MSNIHESSSQDQLQSITSKTSNCLDYEIHNITRSPFKLALLILFRQNNYIFSLQKLFWRQFLCSISFILFPRFFQESVWMKIPSKKQL